MCYHISIPEWSAMDVLLDNAIRNDEWNEYYEHLSAFVFAKIPVLTLENPDKLQAFQWGLIPRWCRDEKEAKGISAMTLNAKSETVFEKSSFKNSMMQKRCLIFVDGFYEWRDYKKKKYPYFIRVKNQNAFALGGIYESWVNEATGEIMNTCSIITTEGNSLMNQIHNTKKRMPLVLPKNKMMEWISPSLTKEQITAAMQPLPDGILEAHTISKLVTSRTEDSNVKEVKDLFVYEELPELVSSIWYLDWACIFLHQIPDT
jgi:putative SOS response-associated peptidase YedK